MPARCSLVLATLLSAAAGRKTGECCAVSRRRSMGRGGVAPRSAPARRPPSTAASCGRHPAIWTCGSKTAPAHAHGFRAGAQRRLLRPHQADDRDHAVGLPHGGEVGRLTRITRIQTTRTPGSLYGDWRLCNWARSRCRTGGSWDQSTFAAENGRGRNGTARLEPESGSWRRAGAAGGLRPRPVAGNVVVTRRVICAAVGNCRRHAS